MSTSNDRDSGDSVGGEAGGANNVDLLIRNAHVLTMDSERRVYPHGAVAVRAGGIVEVGPEREVVQSLRAGRTIDAHGSVVHPGFVDCHSHICLHNLRWNYPQGFTHPRKRSWWDLCFDETEYDGSRLAALEMARNGTTFFLEAGTVMTPDAAATAVEEVGIRASLGDPFVWDIEGSGGPALDRIPFTPNRAFDVMGTELKRNADAEALVRGHVCLRGMGSASDELAIAAKKLADRHGVVLNMHQSFDEPDVARDDQRFGRHPLVHYSEIGLLGENCTFAHVNHIRDDEVGLVLESGMSVIWCPAASMLHGVGGTFNGRHSELHRQGVNVALGCDSANFTTAFDIADQALLALLTAREKTGDADALHAEDVLEMATINGARAVGMADRLGSLEAGKRADLVIRRQDLPEAHPGIDPIRSVVHSSRSKSVDTVIVNGEVIVKRGHSTRVDEEEVYARSRQAARRILEGLDLSPPPPRWPQIE